MKRLILTIMSTLIALPFVNAQDVLTVRKRYNEVRQNIRMQKNIVEMQNSAVLTFKHNVPGIGPQTFKYEIFFTPYEMDENGNLKQHQLTLIQCNFNIGARKFYEEYLYDTSGEPIFIYNRQADESGQTDFIEKRMYYYNKELISMTISTVSNGERKQIMEGKVLGNQYNFMHETYNRAVSSKEMLNGINKNINPNASK